MINIKLEHPPLRYAKMDAFVMCQMTSANLEVTFGANVGGTPYWTILRGELGFLMLIGTFVQNGSATPVFRKQGQGRVVTISSVAAVAPLPFQTYYSCAKASILQLTKALAIEARPFGVQTCCILPGDVKTGFTAARKVSAQTLEGDSHYREACVKAVESMSKDEQQDGMEPEVIAKAVARQLRKRRMNPQCVPSLKYKALVWLIRTLPERVVLWVIGKMYCEK